jgi:hypothetical protein
MTSLGLTLDELVEVVRTCCAIEIQDCTPPYLREFIAARLDNASAELAARVRRFDAGQMARLCEHIRATFALIR